MVYRRELIYLDVYEFQIVCITLLVAPLQNLSCSLKRRNSSISVVLVFVYFSKNHPERIVVRVMINVGLDKLHGLFIPTNNI